MQAAFGTVLWIVDGSERAALFAANDSAPGALRASPHLTIIPQAADQFERALARYEDRPDKGWSLTDCASFLIMEAEGIEAALTYDHHFVQAGFQALFR